MTNIDEKNYENRIRRFIVWYDELWTKFPGNLFIVTPTTA